MAVLLIVDKIVDRGTVMKIADPVIARARFLP